nr:tRNA lysidine(34) synthetase TilS [Sulfitobacter sabulilitoris]
MSSPTQRVLRHILPNPPQAIGVAVSGGGDSMALLDIVHSTRSQHGMAVSAITVDHGLRPASQAEAARVAAYCDARGIPHTVARWTDWSGRGNLQDAARTARYRLIGEWANANGIAHVAMGHTRDDQAETVLMRLARGAGVDGLAAMTPRRLRNTITWMRPMLDVGRAELRAYLRARDIDWIDDPSNEDPQFDRVKARKALALLEPLGITPEALAQVAQNMADARKALGWHSFLAARKMITVDAGAVSIDAKKYRTLPDEIARRLIVQALGWIGGAAYPPRREPVRGMIEALKAGRGATVDGCHADAVGGRIWIFRELNAVKDETAAPDELWDARWRLSAEAGRPDNAAIHVRALGDEGLAQCPDWRASGRPHVVLRSTPAVWEGDRVIAAPLANHPAAWRAELDPGDDAFFAALLSH